MSSPVTEIPFLKMHGLGNDFVVVDARERQLPLSARQIRRIADRHRGVGFDQLVRLEPSSSAIAKVMFFNADGSEAEACGNATRCVVRLLLDETGRGEVVLESAAGPLRGWRTAAGAVTVAMAVPRFDWHDVPLAGPCDTLEVPLDVEALSRPVALSLGNPHAVFFVEDLARLPVERLGPQLERHPLFPEGANIGFAQVLGPDQLRLRVYERGAGLTLACGSGACAALVAAVRRGHVTERAQVVVDGGVLEIAWDGRGPVLMTGPTALSFRGTLSAELLDG